MISIAHIVNPVIVGPESDLYDAQLVTFASMEKARSYAHGLVHVELYSAQYAEDRSLVPEFIIKTRDLEHSVLDCSNFLKKKKLPLITDILSRLLEVSNADFFMYTNVDIALLPFCYTLIERIIGDFKEKNEAFVINRRVTSDKWHLCGDLDLMFAQIGASHSGYDCFIFRRDILTKCDFGNACIGANWIGRVIIANLIANTSHCQIYKDLHATFHIGDAGAWMTGEFNEFDEHNRSELTALLRRLLQRSDVLNSPERLMALSEISDYLKEWYSPKIETNSIENMPRKESLSKRIAGEIIKMLQKVN